MQWLNTLLWWQWTLLALVPPAIVALYFLKLKRRPLVVPSTYLWRKSIEDLHVNSLWQRMRRNLLLLLQLLAVALVMLALLRPSWNARQLAGKRLIFLVDNSASMSATDGAPTRLDEAKQRISDLIQQMQSGQQGMVISFSNTAHVVQGWTANRGELRRAVESVQPSQRPTDLADALRVAAGSAGQGSMRDQQAAEELAATLYIFSDGRFSDVQDFSLGALEPVFVPIGRRDSANLGIVAFGVRPRQEQASRLQAFGRLENHGDQPVAAQIELYHDDELIDASEASIEAGGSTGVAFDLGETESGVLKLRIAADDALSADNEAWAVINPSRRARVLLVTTGNEDLQNALTTRRAAEVADVSLAQPEILLTPQHQRAAASGAMDLIIYDRCRPTEPPQCNTLFIGALPPRGWSAGAEVTLPAIIDANAAHPLMQHIDMSEVEVFRATPLEPPPGATKLVDSSAGGLLAIAPREAFEDAVVGFGFQAPDAGGQLAPNTTWTIRQDFPVFILNTLSYLGGARDPLATNSVRPGQPITLRTDAAVERLVIHTPSGAAPEVTRGRLNTFQFAGTDELGVYGVDEGGNRRQNFAVNLFDGAESDLRTRPENTLKIGYVEIEGKSAWVPARREIWRWLLLGVLAILLGEWYIYSRRVY